MSLIRMTDRPWPLSVALLTDDFFLPKWQAEALLQLQTQGTVSVVRTVAVGGGIGVLERFARNSIAALEALVYKLNGNRPDMPVDARSVFPAAVPARDTGSLPGPVRLSADLAVNCGVSDKAAGRFDTRLGILTCTFGGAPGEIGLYRALMLGRRDLCLVVQLDEGEERRVLDQAWPSLPVRPLFYEAARTACRRAAALLSKALRELASGESPAARAPARVATYREIDMAGLCGHVLQRCASSLRERSRKLFEKPTWVDVESNWFLAYRTNPSYFVCNTERFCAHGFQLILPPPDRFYADPCVIEHEGVHHIFFEEWSLESAKGGISWMRMDQGRPSAAEPVLERPYHLSYPFVFRVGHDFFMIPETASARRIELYKAVDFPTRWEPVEILLEDVIAADATLFEHDGRWWMFVTVGEDGSSRSDQLCLYHADSVWGPWRPHRRNPVKIDVRSSRPAGRLFQRGGKLVRPTQDCSTRYGGALTLCEVRDLSLRDYVEAEVETLSPDWLASNIGFHTLSHCGGLEVIDGKMRPGKRTRFPVSDYASELKREARAPLATPDLNLNVESWPESAPAAVPPSRAAAGR